MYQIIVDGNKQATSKSLHGSIVLAKQLAGQLKNFKEILVLDSDEDINYLIEGINKTGMWL